MSDTAWIILCLTVVTLTVLWFWRHQRMLARRAHMMEEAIRNRDLTFRLPTRHMFSGERALQESLNRLGEHVREQVNLGEVESWEKLTRVLTHEIMNATAPIASISQSMLNSPAIKESGLEEGILAISGCDFDGLDERYVRICVPVLRSLSRLTGALERAEQRAR